MEVKRFTMKFNKKLQLLFDEYLATLDDKDKDEWYTTERRLSEIIFQNFIEWLSKNPNLKNKV